jgi:drug/metabolite transporter (DMT)-like permease
VQSERLAMASAALGISAVGAGVAASDHLTAYPVLSAQAARYAVGAAVLGAVAWPSMRREPRLGARDRVRLVALALSGMVLFNVAIVRAVTTGEPAVVATIVGLAPVGLALVVPALDRRRPRAGILAGAALAAIGAAAVEGFGHADLAALAWSVVALAGEVAFTVLAAPLLRTISPVGLTVRACALASVLLVCAAALLDGRQGFARPDAAEAMAIGYLALASTAVAFVLWYRAVSRLGAERTGLFTGLMPVSAALAGAAVAGASLRAGTLAGTILTGAGLAVGLRPPGRENPHARDRDVARQTASSRSSGVRNRGVTRTSPSHVTSRPASASRADRASAPTSSNSRNATSPSGR